jgi:hypothetical protein
MKKNKLTSLTNSSGHSKPILLMIATALFFVALFAINRNIPITKNEMLEMAKNRQCPVRLELYFRDNITSYDTCIIALKSDFSNLSSSDRADVAAMYILYGKLDTGTLAAFIELIEPDRTSILNKLDNFSDIEIRSKFNASDFMINDYRRSVSHYKESFERYN